MSVRALTADRADGRWTWDESGTPHPFEDVERYRRRRISERLDRALLLEYLAALDIPIAGDNLGAGHVIQQHVPWQRRALSLEEARTELA